MDDAKWTWTLAGGVVILVVGLALYRYGGFGGIDQAAAPPQSGAPEAAAVEAPAVRYPVPEAAIEEPASAGLSTLDASDEAVRSGMEQLFGAGPVDALLVPQDVIRRLVVMIDNLPGDGVPIEQRPLRKVAGSFAVQSADGRLSMSPENAGRYAPFVDAFQSADTGLLTGFYFRYYPLFQQAYQDLGYPGRYFNDRLIAVIDHLLQTPEVVSPVALVQPKVMFEYADPRLQALSAGQKAVIRMGSVNAAAFKNKLREIRSEIVAKSQRPQLEPQGRPAG